METIFSEIIKTTKEYKFILILLLLGLITLIVFKNENTSVKDLNPPIINSKKK